MAVTVERLVAEVDADPSAAIAGLTALEAAVDAAARDRTATLTVDYDRSYVEMGIAQLEEFTHKVTQAGSAAGGAGGGMSTLTSGIGGAGGAARGAAMGFGMFAVQAGVMAASLVLVAGAIPYVISGINAIAGAAVGLAAALAPAIGLLGALPGLMAAVGGGLTAGIAGFSGIGGALDAMGQADKALSAGGGGGASAANQARQVAAAERQLVTATHQVTEAREELRSAEEALGDARRQAMRDLQDQRLRYEQAVLSQASAVDALSDAQKRLDDAQRGTAKSAISVTKQTDDFTGKVYEVARVTADATDQQADIEDAQRGVLQAQLNLKQANIDVLRSRQDLSAAEKDGVKQADIVVAARERISDAEWGLKQALDGVKQAQDAIKQAQQGAGASGGAAATTALRDAMKELSPAGRSFVRFLYNEFIPAWKEVKKEVQEALLPPIETGLRNFLPFLEGTIGPRLVGFADTLGRAIGSFLTEISSGDWARDIDLVLGSSNRVLGSILRGARNIARAFTTIAVAARPLTEWLAEAFAQKMSDFADKMAEMERDGRLEAFFTAAKEAAQDLWSILSNLAGIIFGVLRAAFEPGKSLLDDMNAGLADLNEKVNSVEGQSTIRAWIDDAIVGFKALWDLIKDIAGGFVTIGEDGKGTMTDFEEVIQDIRDAGPGFKKFLQDSASLVSGLNKMVMGLFQAWSIVKALLFPMFPIYKAGIDRITGVTKALWEATKNVWNWWGELFDTVERNSPAMRGLIDGIKETWNNLKEAFNKGVTRFKELWQEFKDMFTLPDINWPDPPEWLGKLGSLIPGGGAFSERQFGGPVRKGQAYIVGEKRPEIFIPSQSGRIAPSTDALESGGGGVTDAQLERILSRVLTEARPDVRVEQTFNEKVDPLHVGAEMVWRLGR